MADALLAELLGSAEHARVLARYRADHEWDAESVAVVLQLIEDLHASGRITDTAVRDLRREISSWDLTRDADSTDELPALASFALDDPTEELDDTDVTLVLPPDVEQQLGLAAAGEEPAVMPA
ncbi:MAG TPA: hypothetical protein VLT59_11155, partial [Steroidobacteraceae bacterium]|nr:hypothetical protein [Steroidobacteraceae bacterium]